MPSPARPHLLCGKAGAGKRTLARLFGDRMKTLEDHRALSRRAGTAVGPSDVDLLAAGQNVAMDSPANTRSTRTWFRSLVESAAADGVLHHLEAPDMRVAAPAPSGVGPLSANVRPHRILFSPHRRPGPRSRTMIVVLGNVVAREGQLAPALALSLEHVARSRTEPGCIAHAVHQDAENPSRLVFVEQWESQEALWQHFMVPASRAFAEALAELAAQRPSMAIYEVTPVQMPGKSAA